MFYKKTARLLIAILVATGLYASSLAALQLSAQSPGLVKDNIGAYEAEFFSPQVSVSADQAALEAYYSYNSGNFFFPPYESDADRMGFGKASDHDASGLKAGWYVDWAANINPPHPGGAEYARTIYFKVSNTGSACASYKAPATRHDQITPNITDESLVANIQQNPGALWLVGNEPDSIYNGSPIQAELYAELYHKYYTLIKETDPTAKVGIGAIVQPSPLRRAYLDKVLAHYQTTYTQTLPTDLWNIHSYILNEQSCGWGAGTPPFSAQSSGWLIEFTAADMLNVDDMEAHLRDFRQWMADRGYQDIPLIITEFGVLPPPDYSGFSDNVAAQFLDDIFNVLLTAADPEVGYPADENRLVQMWAWFSTNHWYGGDLFNDSGNTLTVIGEAFVEQVQNNWTNYVDLQLVLPFFDPRSQKTLPIFVNNTGTITAASTTVQLTMTDYFSQTIATDTLVTVPELGPRYTGQPFFTTQPGQPGLYTVTLEVDPDRILSETNTLNNMWEKPVDWNTDLVLAGYTSQVLSVGSPPLTWTVMITVANAGQWPVSDVPVEFNWYNSQNLLLKRQAFTFTTIQPAVPEYLTDSLVISTSDTYSFTVVVNGNEQAGVEFDDTNNSRNLLLALKPDLVMESVDLGFAGNLVNLENMGSLQFTATIVNNGLWVSESVPVAFELNGSNNSLVQTQNKPLPGLTPSQRQLITSTWAITRAGFYTLTVTADPPPGGSGSLELETGNNTLTRTFFVFTDQAYLPVIMK